MATKIFVIDDDNAVTDLLSVLLTSQGFEVWATNSSTEGLTHIRENTPDLVILDLMMPEMDGRSAGLCVHSVMCPSSFFLHLTTRPWLPVCWMLALTIT